MFIITFIIYYYVFWCIFKVAQLLVGVTVGFIAIFIHNKMKNNEKYIQQLNNTVRYYSFLSNKSAPRIKVPGCKYAKKLKVPGRFPFNKSTRLQTRKKTKSTRAASISYNSTRLLFAVFYRVIHYT